MKVYHLNILATQADFDEVNRVGWDGHPRFTMHADITSGDTDAAAAAFSEGFYKEVCTMYDRFGGQELDLDDAFVKTQNIDKPWDPMGKHRSTTVGDIIERKGRFYMVAAFGFEELEALSNNRVAS